MKMTDGDCQSVCRVVRLRHGFHSKQKPHHFLNLMFFGIAVTDDRLLNQTRAVFGNFQTDFFAQITAPRREPVRA